MIISVKKTFTAIAIGSALTTLSALPAKAIPEHSTNMTTQKIATSQTLYQKLFSWRLLTNKTIAKRNFWYRQTIALKNQTQIAIKDRNQKEIKLFKATQILEEISKNNSTKITPTDEVDQTLSPNLELIQAEEAKNIANKEYLQAKINTENLYNKFRSAKKTYNFFFSLVKKYYTITKRLEIAYNKEQWITNTRTSVVNAAISRVGSAYTYGGEGPWGFDCSGLTMWSYAQVGISIPHYSGAQMVTPRAIPVPLDKMLPGDLMYFGAGGSRHAAIYIGNGQVVEANNPSTGVRIDPAFASWNMYDYAGSTRLIY